MRRSYEGSIIKNSKDEFVGVNLGADYCAEHEWGISRMCSRLGIANNSITVGVDRRRVTKGENIGGGIVTINKKKYFYIYSASIRYMKNHETASVREIMEYQSIGPEEYTMARTGFVAGWDEMDFQLLLDTPYVEQGKELLEALNNNDAMIYTGKSSNPFGRGGLNIVILSRMDTDVLAEMKDSDEDNNRLMKAAEETGIYEILRKAHKRYFALSPRWKDQNKTEVVFFLNPMEQSKYNFGWYGVRELKQWAKDKGPIVKKEGESEW